MKVLSKINSSPADSRVYKAIELSNGLKVILIHDSEIQSAQCASKEHSREQGVHEGTSSEDESHSECDSDEGSLADGSTGGDEEMGTKRAAAALSVGVGHFCDPDELPGLSHYLEHMLFMGSEKFPDEHEYDAYLNQHNGSSNAFTEEESTTFHFECAPDAFWGALDRFAQFFIAPLFKQDAMEREVLAIDSEFSGVLQSDSCRLSQSRASMVAPGHPASKFGWGNKESLFDQPAAKGVNVRDRIIEYYKRFYSAERMNLVILSGEEISVMESWVEEHFAGIPCSDMTSRTRFDHMPLIRNDLQLSVIPSSRDENKVTVSFYLPSWLEKQYGKKAEDYISHLVGHEGKGSLLACLKHSEWATDLCAGVSEQNSSYWLFEITVTLTDSGLDAEPGCGLRVVRAVFRYLDMLQSMEPQKWVWDEMKAIARLKWAYLEEEDPSDYVSQISSDMHHVPLHHILEWSFLHDEFDPALIQQILGYMVPERAAIELQTKSYGKQVARMTSMRSVSNVQEISEKWFQFDFSVCQLDPAVVRHDRTQSEQMYHLPKQNPYIATDTSVVSKEHVSGHRGIPTRVSTSSSPDVFNATLFHLMDTEFRVPKISSFYKFHYTISDISPRHAALTHLTVKLLEDVLCEETYLADMAGMHYSIYMDGHGSIDFRIEGFSEKIDQLTHLVFSTLARLEFKDDDFARVKETVHRHYSNALIKPTKHATFLRLQTLKHQQVDPRDVMIEIQSIEGDQVRQFSKTLVEKGHLASLIIGNCTKEAAQNLCQIASNSLGFTHSTSHMIPHVMKLQGNIIRKEVAVNPQEENSSIEYYIQVGHAISAKERSLLDLVDQILYAPCYNILRTQKQLGYIVSSGTRLTHGVQGLCIVIQSRNHAAVHLEHEIDTFLIEFLDTLTSMSDTEFENNKKALIEHKQQKDRNLSDQGERLWDALINRSGEFDHRQADIHALHTITHANVVDFYTNYIAPIGIKTRKLTAHVDPPSRKTPVETAKESTTVIHDTSALHHLHTTNESYPSPPIIYY
ncbi:hypothetical protein M9434_000751 [Picochlorum sp. BPE23]|nr:hypothetical protein M9434_000751 [Picochlorum sp. BPE23]